MSLTSRLRRRDDPLRVFFEDRLPNLAPMQQAVKEAGEVMLLPSEPVPYGTVERPWITESGTTLP